MEQKVTTSRSTYFCANWQCLVVPPPRRNHLKIILSSCFDSIVWETVVSSNAFTSWKTTVQWQTFPSARMRWIRRSPILRYMSENAKSNIRQWEPLRISVEDARNMGGRIALPGCVVVALLFWILFQVVDGFTVKRTKDLRESISYLSILTRYLQSLYGVSVFFCTCFV